jgi:hypothetical protein
VRCVLAGAHPGKDAAVDLAKAVYALPWLDDFSQTHQWVREMRRWRSGRMIAVDFRLPKDEPMYVGRYGKPHRAADASAAVTWVRANPAGAQVVIPRSLPRSSITRIRPITQLVGWTETPETTHPFACVCPGCLTPGMPQRQRRLHAAYRRAASSLRVAETLEATFQALNSMETALEEASGSWSPAALLPFVQTPSADLRARIARTLRYYQPSLVVTALVQLAADEVPGVRREAIDSLGWCAGLDRATAMVKEMDDAAALALLDHAAFRSPTVAHARSLATFARSTSPNVRARARELIAETLADEEPPPKARALLRAAAAD